MHHKNVVKTTTSFPLQQTIALNTLISCIVHNLVILRDRVSTYSLCLYFQKKQGTNMPTSATASQNIVTIGSTASLERLGSLISCPLLFTVDSIVPIFSSLPIEEEQGHMMGVAMTSGRVSHAHTNYFQNGCLSKSSSIYSSSSQGFSAIRRISKCPEVSPKIYIL